jgi:23S rRNA-intervening sequence protein
MLLKSPRKGRSSDKEFVLFLCHARGSLLEVETQIIIAQGLQYLGDEEGRDLLARTAELRQHVEWANLFSGKPLKALKLGAED